MRPWGHYCNICCRRRHSEGEEEEELRKRTVKLPSLNLLRGSSGVAIPVGVWRDRVICREASTRPRGEPREKK